MVNFYYILCATTLLQVFNISAADYPTGDNTEIPIGDVSAPLNQPINLIPHHDNAIHSRYDPSIPNSIPNIPEVNHSLTITPSTNDSSYNVMYQNDSIAKPVYYSANFNPHANTPNDTSDSKLEPTVLTNSYSLNQSTTLQNIIPQNITPQNTMPRNAMPLHIAPQQIITPNSIPQSVISQNITPQQSMPPNAIPQNVMPQNIIPQNIIPQNIIPQNTIPQDMMPQNIMPQNALPQQIMPLNAMPQNMMPQHHTIPQNITPQNIISNNTPTYQYYGNEIHQQADGMYTQGSQYKTTYETLENQKALQNAEIQRHQELLNQLSSIMMPPYSTPPQNYPLTSQVSAELANNSFNSYLQQLPNENSNQNNIPYMTSESPAVYSNTHMTNHLYAQPSHASYNTDSEVATPNSMGYPIDTNPIVYTSGNNAIPNHNTPALDNPMAHPNVPMYDNLLMPNTMNGNVHPNSPNGNLESNNPNNGLQNLLNPASFLAPVTNTPIVNQLANQLLQFPPLSSALQSVGILPGNIRKGEEQFVGLNSALQAPMRSAASMASNVNPGMLMAHAGHFINAGQTLMNASNAVMNSLPMEQILGASQQLAKVAEAQDSAKYNPELQPVVRCASAGITCCIPEQYLSGEWKRNPPVLNDMPDDNKLCRAHFIPIQNSLCATTTYEGDNLCGLVKGETHDFITYRHVLTLRGKTKGRAVCECRWRKEFHNPANVFGEFKNSNTEMPIPDPDTPPVEGFAIWEISKKEKHEAEKSKQNAARFAQTLGATIKVAKLLGEKVPGALENVQGNTDQRPNATIQGAESNTVSDPTSIISAVANAAATAFTGSGNNNNNHTSNNSNKQVDWVNRMADMMMEQGEKIPAGSAINRAVEDFLALERSKH